MKDQLIQQIISANKRLLTALSKIPDQSEVNQDWSKKELLAHIAGWYEEGVNGVQKILNGQKPDSFRMSINGYNKRSIQKRKDMTTDQIMTEMEELKTKFLNQLKNLTDEQINGYFGTKLGNKPINLLWMINEQISHDTAHAEELEKR